MKTKWTSIGVALYRLVRTVLLSLSHRDEWQRRYQRATEDLRVAEIRALVAETERDDWRDLADAAQQNLERVKRSMRNMRLLRRSPNTNAQT